MIRINNNKGFSLVEVLIAIFILSIGLLGVAGMQVTAISANSFAQTGTVAIALAEEMVDRVRSHAGTSPEDYHGINTSNSVAAIQAAYDDPIEGDTLAWKSRLESSLPNPVGTVSVSVDNPTANADTVTIVVSWGRGRSLTVTTILETWGT